MAKDNDENQKSEKPKKPLEVSNKGTHREELVDHYWGSMNHVNGMIKASEIKAGLILSFYGILLNLIYQSIQPSLGMSTIDTLLYTIAGFWFLATAVSIYFCIRCFTPKIEGNYDHNVFFFGDVITKFGDIKQFAKTFYEISLDEKELFQQLGEQIFVISKIAAWKFKNVKRAILFLAISLALLLITVVYYTLTNLS
ncbi:Pycsar system effector family protein [Maribacter sp. 2308TA10-17]|uniref:Pycsar system effector family protein n=1 Tax=Maribacter sp. 2308TA10-17 TaxID=3386276 RepID=UPI0039BCF91D